MTDVEWMMLGWLAILFGIRFGAWLEARKWRANAKTYIRLESGGKIFKVTECEP